MELFVDDHLIDQLNGARLKLHEPRHAGAAIVFDRPYEGVHCCFSTVIHDGDTYRLYYRAAQSEKKGQLGMKDGYDGEYTCYAESRDGGITFAKPSLGLYEVMGSRDNNVCYAFDPPFSTNFSPLLDTRPGVAAEERFKAVAGMGSNMLCFRGKRAWLPIEKSGIHGFVSPDGRRWKPVSAERIFDDGARARSTRRTPRSGRRRRGAT